jgi:hypothetical protein
MPRLAAAHCGNSFSPPDCAPGDEGSPLCRAGLKRFAVALERRYGATAMVDGNAQYGSFIAIVGQQSSPAGHAEAAPLIP